MEVLIDIGVNLGHYHSDMTRVLFFKSVESTVMAVIYDLVAEAQRRALNCASPERRLENWIMLPVVISRKMGMARISDTVWGMEWGWRFMKLQPFVGRSRMLLLN